MRAGDPVHDFGLAHRDAERHSGSNALGHADDVGMDATVLNGKPFAGTADAALDFIHYQQDAVLVADAAQLFHEDCWSNDISAFALNRLDKNRGDFFWREDRLEKLLFNVARAAEREFLRILRTAGTSAIDIGIADMRNARHHRRETPLLLRL